MAEQAKLPTTEKPVLLSKDIEAKMAALDREVQYLLNKAKFAKPRPRPRDKNGTRAEAPLNASASDQSEKVIPPPGEGRGLVQASLGRRKLSLPSGDYLFLLVSLQARLKTRSPSQNPRRRLLSRGSGRGVWTSFSPEGLADWQDSLSLDSPGALNGLYIL